MFTCVVTFCVVTNDCSGGATTNGTIERVKTWPDSCFRLKSLEPFVNPAMLRRETSSRRTRPRCSKSRHPPTQLIPTQEGKIKTFEELDPEGQGQNLALNVLYVQCTGSFSFFVVLTSVVSGFGFGSALPEECAWRAGAYHLMSRFKASSLWLSQSLWLQV